MSDDTEYLTAEQAAQRLQISVASARAYMSTGQLGGSWVGRGWRTTPADIADYYERNRNRPGRSGSGQTRRRTT